MPAADSWEKLIEIGYGGGGVSKRLVYDFDGIDDYISIPQVDLVAGDTVTFKFISPTSSSPTIGDRTVISSDGGVNLFVLSSDGTYNINNGTATLDGLPIDSDDFYPTDGKVYSVVWSCSSSSVLGLINSNSLLIPRGNFPIFDVDIQAASGNRFYQINDGWSANPVIADSVSGQDGTAFNFNEENWIEIDV